MGDLSAEPSMEDILSSIKRIIAEEGDQPARRARPARAGAAMPLASPVEPSGDDEVLELSDPMPSRAEPAARPAPASAASPALAPEPAQVAEVHAPEPRATAAPAAEPIVSTEAAAASRGALESLSRLLVKPEPGNDGTLEGLVRELLRPMLREWLDANLPQLVEAMVSREIARITRP